MEKQITKNMIDWLNHEYGREFDFNKIEGAIELMLNNHKRKVLEEAIDLNKPPEPTRPMSEGQWLARHGGDFIGP